MKMRNWILIAAIALLGCAGIGYAINASAEAEERLVFDAKVYAKGDVALWREMTPVMRCDAAHIVAVNMGLRYSSRPDNDPSCVEHPFDY